MHATRNFAGPRAIQFWTLHAGRGNAPLQDAVGWERRTALVVWAGNKHGYDYPVAAGFRVSLRSARLATLARIDRDSSRTFDRALHTVSWRWQPPVVSPISPVSLASAVGDPSRLFTRYHRQDLKTLCGREAAMRVLLRYRV